MIGLWHFSFHVRDIDSSVHFYEQIVGLQLVKRQDQANEYTRELVGFPDASLRVAQLRIPGQPRGASSHDLELVEYVIPRSREEVAARYHPGTAHLAFGVLDIHREYDRLLAAGVEFISAPLAITEGVNKGGYACYFVDPDGITLELVQPPPRVT